MLGIIKLGGCVYIYISNFNAKLFISDLTTLPQENYLNSMKLTTILLMTLGLSTPVAQGTCSQQADAHLTGLNTTAIPRNLGEDIEFLSIYDTGISVLNLTLADYYPALCRLQVKRSPVSAIFIPDPPSIPPLTHFHLRSGYFSAPPSLGTVLAGQLTHLVLEGLGIKSIPDKFFQNYTQLLSLSMVDNPLTSLNEGNLEGLDNLESLALKKTNLNPLPPLYLWLPDLVNLNLGCIGLTEIPPNLLQNLPNLKRLNLWKNQLTTVPGRSYFVNLHQMAYVRLTGNPLHCDYRLSWIKVSFGSIDCSTWISENILSCKGPYTTYFGKPYKQIHVEPGSITNNFEIIIDQYRTYQS